MSALTAMIGGYFHDPALTALCFDAWFKSLILLAVAGGLCLCCQRAAAATRHWIWFLALASLPCLLLLSAVPRVWHRPLWLVSTGFDPGNQFSLVLDLTPARQPVNPTPAAPLTGPAPAGAGEPRVHSRQPLIAHFSATAAALGMLVWLVGASAGLLSVLAGQLQIRRLARNALLLDTAEWLDLLRDAGETLRLRRPGCLLLSRDNPMPLTWGGWRPVVLLPAAAANWPTERRRVVLLHELAHAKRWDCLTQSVARVVCSLYWINPLAWLAARRMCRERERACDDLVLNSGCRASDYATHLVNIARSFPRPLRLAGIAMARSSQLHGRIAAIVDASRARRLRPLTALALVGLIGALALSVAGSSADAARHPAEDSGLRQQQLAQLEAFARAKEKQAGELAARAGEKITPEFQRFFDAAIRGDGPTVTNRFWYFRAHHGQYEHDDRATIANLRTAYWQPVLELCLAYNQFQDCDPKYTALYADGIIDSIPPGSIYFGGTDTGRGVPTAFCKSHADANPFFTLTHNALADATYLDYLRAMYGGRIYTPTAEDSQKCFQEYLADAQRRLQEHQLKPGEDVKMVKGKVQVAGQVSVMNINGLLTKVIFDHNPDREFCVEESFPLDWMYPHLEPHGLIMKLNRQPLTRLPEEVMARDHEYWRKEVGGMVGDWLDDQTTVSKIVEFVERVYVRKDLKGFRGDPDFVRNLCAQQEFSKLRSSIAGAYAWRLSPYAPQEYQPKTEVDRQALVHAADFAFRQAFVLCPSSPEAIFRYVQLLLQRQRFDDALLVAQAGLKADPKNGQVRSLLETIKSYKKLDQSQGSVQRMEDSLLKNPKDFQTAFNLASAYLARQETNRAIPVLNRVLNSLDADPAAFHTLIQAYAGFGNIAGVQRAIDRLEACTNLDADSVLSIAHGYAALGNVPRQEAALERLTQLTPTSPEAWYDLAAIRARTGKTAAGLSALRQALALSAGRLKRDPRAPDLLLNASKDESFASLRQLPEFKQLVPPQDRGGERPTGASKLTDAQAEALAERLANEKAQVLYNCQPFREGTPAQFIQGYWLWRDLRAQGSFDVEATVKFAADGASPEVKVLLLDSRANLALPPERR